MTSKLIGIEFGSDTLKLAVSLGGVIKTLAVERMPENLVREGKITAPTAMSAFLKSTLRKYGILGGRCALVLPSQAVISHRVTMPVMSEAEIRLNLPYEFHDFVGKEGAKYTYDYVIHDVNNNQLNLWAIAVKTETVESYYSILRRAGLTLKIAIPIEMAWQNLLLHATNEPERLCVVDAGHTFTRVGFYESGKFAMGKEIEMGGLLLDETIADKLKVDIYVARVRKESNMDSVLASKHCTSIYNAIATEVIKLITFYNQSDDTKKAPLSDVYFCGGLSAIEGLRTAINKSADMTIHHPQRLLNLAEGVDAELCKTCAAAAGAALQSK